MGNNSKHFYEFDEFRLDPSERQLLSGGREIPLTPKAYAVLSLLVEQSGHTLTKEDFMREVWGDSFVEEKNLADNISILRQALGDDPKTQRYIKTVPRRGYRFVADVHRIQEDAEELVVAERTRASVVIEEDLEQARGRTAEGVTHPVDVPPLALPAEAKKRSRVLTLAVACAALAMLVVGALYYFTSRKPRSASPQFKSLAVLPFKQLGAAQADDLYLGPGLTDALITRLSNVRQIAVRPTSAVLKYAGPQADLVAVAREQQVDAVLDGSFQRVGERLRVTVQLVRGDDGTPLWAQTFDENLRDIFAVQDSISARVTEALKLRLTEEEGRRLTKTQTASAEAYQLYLRGRYHWNRRTPDGITKAVEYLHQAVTVDPSFALAHAALADAYALLPEYTNASVPESLTKAREAAQRALEIDNTLAEAYVSLGYIKYVQWDWEGIEEQYRRGLELNPNYATAHQWYSEYLVHQGRMEEAMREIRQAQQLDPLSLIINTRIGMTFYYWRRYDEAIEQLRKTLEFNPDFILIHIFLYRSLFEKGQHQETIPHIVRGFFNSYVPEEKAKLEAKLKAAFEARGVEALWVEVRDQLLGAERSGFNYAFTMAETYMRLGDKNEAFLWLGRAAEKTHPGVAALRVDPAMDVLREDPRFAELLRRVNLPSQ